MHPEIPMALITGWDDEVKTEQVQESHVQTVIGKPFESEENAASGGCPPGRVGEVQHARWAQDSASSRSSRSSRSSSIAICTCG